MPTVAIIGAGPSGTSAAYQLAQASLEVLLIDTKTFPRNKACAGVLPPRVLLDLEVEGLPLPKDLVQRELEGYALVAPSGRMALSDFACPGAVVKRSELDNWLLQRAGVGLVQDTIDGILEDEDGVTLTGRKDQYFADMVIIATGAASRLGRHIHQERPLMALTHQFELKMDTSEIKKRVGNRFWAFYIVNGGHAWISPLRDSLKVGIGSVAPGFDARKELMHLIKSGPIADLLNPELDPELDLEHDLEHDLIQEEAGLIPMSGPPQKLSTSRCLLAGDAGGFVFPGTGEGLFYALRSGKVAAQCIKDHGTQAHLQYQSMLTSAGLLSLRDVDHLKRTMATPEASERYVSSLAGIK